MLLNSSVVVGVYFSGLIRNRCVMMRLVSFVRVI